MFEFQSIFIIQLYRCSYLYDNITPCMYYSGYSGMMYALRLVFINVIYPQKPSYCIVLCKNRILQYLIECSILVSRSGDCSIRVYRSIFLKSFQNDSIMLEWFLALCWKLFQHNYRTLLASWPCIKMSYPCSCQWKCNIGLIIVDIPLNTFAIYIYSSNYPAKTKRT